MKSLIRLKVLHKGLKSAYVTIIIVKTKSFKIANKLIIYLFICVYYAVVRCFWKQNCKKYDYTRTKSAYKKQFFKISAILAFIKRIILQNNYSGKF